MNKRIYIIPAILTASTIAITGCNSENDEPEQTIDNTENMPSYDYSKFENTSIEDKEEVRTVVDEFTETLNAVDMDYLYEEIYEDDSSRDWDDEKERIYEISYPLFEQSGTLNYLDYTKETPEDEKIDQITRLFLHTSFFHYPYAYFLEGEESYVVFDNDYIAVNGDTAEVYIVPREYVSGSESEEEEIMFREMFLEEFRPIELNKIDDEWIINIDTLGAEITDDYIENGDPTIDTFVY